MVGVDMPESSSLKGRNQILGENTQKGNYHRDFKFLMNFLFRSASARKSMLANEIRWGPHNTPPRNYVIQGQDRLLKTQLGFVRPIARYRNHRTVMLAGARSLQTQQLEYKTELAVWGRFQTYGLSNITLGQPIGTSTSRFPQVNTKDSPIFFQNPCTENKKKFQKIATQPEENPTLPIGEYKTATSLY